MKDPKIGILSIFIFLFLIFGNISAQYIWPIDGKVFLNSNFAECRPNHFHAGLDLQAKEGTPLKAIETGYIWHISVSPFGYGKSLFLKLDDGRIFVYAHLKKFSERVEKIIELKQRKSFSYRVSLYYKEDYLTVEKGDLIGYVGKTGTQGAHLHFEMRDASNRPINSLTHGFKVTDSNPPLIKGIAIIPLDDSSFVSGVPFPVIIKPYLNGNHYTFSDTITVSGRIGLEVRGEDYQDTHPFRLNICKAELYLNGNLVFSSHYERFSYAHTREVELEFDYDLYNRGVGRFHRLFIYGNNHLSFYEKRNGILHIETIKKINEIKIVCYDTNKNRSVLIFFLRRGEYSESLASNSPYNLGSNLSFYRNLVRVAISNTGEIKIVKMTNLFPVRQGFEKCGSFSVNYFRLLPRDEAVCSLVVEHSRGKETLTCDYNTILRKSGGIIKSSDREFMVIIEENILYEDIFARVRKIKESLPEGLRLLKGAYLVEPVGTVFKQGVKIAFPYHENYSKKIGIYKKKKTSWLYLEGGYDVSRNAFVAKSNHLGIFALLEDNIPPEISDFQTVKKGNLITKISFKAKDTGTGFRIADINIAIDGVPYIPFYDLYRDEVSFMLFKKRIEEGGHTAKIKIKDRAGNKSSLTVSF